QPIIVEIGGKRFCLAHGDGLGRIGFGGWLLQKFLKGRLSIALTRWLVPARWLDAFAAVWSRSSRRSNSANPYVFDRNSTLFQYACEFEKKNQVDYFIFGHVHRPVEMETPGGARLFILDDWADGPNWLETDGTSLSRHSRAEDGADPGAQTTDSQLFANSHSPSTMGSDIQQTPVYKTDNLQGIVGMSVSAASLRGSHSQGIGDLGDVRLLTDLAKALGMKRIELQSVVDTAAGTACGTPIYPVYVNLEQAGHLMNSSREAGYKASAASLENRAGIDYAAVYNTKLHYLFDLFRQEGSEVLGSDEYHAFWKANRPWLEQYAAYCALRHKYGTGNSRYWSEPNYTRLLEDEHFIKEYSEDLRFHCYVQFLAHKQLMEVTRYAAGNGIELSVSGDAGQTAASGIEPWVAEENIRKKLQDKDASHILPLAEWLSVTSLAAFPSQDNIPAAAYDPKAGVAGYRMAMPLEAILSHKALLGQIRKMIEESAK
ncbi:MAG: 4-alpha-glucanotransferase, partial [Bacteroidales bacterium]|nr:4-alpha-glucanotransferase [Bacteroidales bacterium]